VITASIVSHGHGSMVVEIANQLSKSEFVKKIVITLNIPEDLSCDNEKIIIVNNTKKKGFGANHNKAFRDYCNTEFFLVINPDVKLNPEIFKELVYRMSGSDLSFCAVKVLNSHAELENSYRDFPNATHLLKKLFKIKIAENLNTLKINNKIFSDWIAGMFLLFKSDSYMVLNGFDQSTFFLYYEDVDICYRAKLQNMRYIVWDDLAIEHNAQRDSHKKIKYAALHFCSHVKFLLRYYFGRGLVIKRD
jgi:GT2 family glycosyltransferase